MRWSPPLAIDRGDLHHDKLFEQIIKMDSILIHFVIYDTHANNLFLSGNWILIKKCPDNLFVQIVYINCLFILWCIRYEFSEIAINHDLNPIFTIQAILFNSTYSMLWFLRNIWISLQKCPETWFPGADLFAFPPPLPTLLYSGLIWTYFLYNLKKVLAYITIQSFKTYANKNMEN